MKHLDVDVAIVGAGSAGMAAYQTAARHTDRIVVIEAQGYGTLCARAGCMPSKLLIAAADHAHAIGQAHRFGVHAIGSHIDGASVMARIHDLRQHFLDGVLREVQTWPRHHRLEGWARFTGPHELAVGGHTRVTAKRIVLATGSQAQVPDAWREALGPLLLTTDTLFDLPSLPSSVAVVGGGAIGVEMAQALHRLNVRVAWLVREDSVGGLQDAALRPLTIPLLAEGINLVTGVDIRGMGRSGPHARIDFRVGAEQGSTVAEHVLVCTGRRPRLQGLDLDKAGLALDSDGMPQGFDDRTTRLGDSDIHLAGDANGAHPLLHEAVADGQRAAGMVPSQPRRTPLRIVFCDPQIAAVGQPLDALTRTGHRVAVGVADFSDQGRSLIKGAGRGLLRIYVCRDSRRVLGAEMIGPCAEHLAHLLAWAIHQSLTLDAVLDCPFYHPVVEEAVRTALRHANKQLQKLPMQAPCQDGPTGESAGDDCSRPAGTSIVQPCDPDHWLQRTP